MTKDRSVGDVGRGQRTSTLTNIHSPFTQCLFAPFRCKGGSSAFLNIKDTLPTH